VVVAVDPSTTSTGDMAGITVQGQGLDGHVYLIADLSLQSSPKGWAIVAVKAFRDYHANKIVAERNQGGQMVADTIATVDPLVPVELVWASRGKEIRAEPVSALYEHGRAHHIGAFPALEDELCFAAGTLVTTDRGDVEIERIWPGDRVLTRNGFREVLRSGCTSRSAAVLKITTRGGRCLLTTHGHPLYCPTEGRFVPARDMKEGSWVSILTETVGTERALSCSGCGGTSTRRGITSIGKAYCCIGRSTTGCTGSLSSADNCSTTSTGTGRTTPQRIFNSFRRLITSAFMKRIGGASPRRDDFPGSGASIGNPIPSNGNASAASAENRSRPSRPMPTTAPVAVHGDIIGRIEVIEERIPVFNLFVAGTHEYFENGILVHNCLWTPGDGVSPNRLDSLVWGATWLMGFKQGQTQLEELLNGCVV